MLQLFYIAFGGALGALARFGLSQLINGLHVSRVPWGTLTVNLVGSVIIGVVFVMIVEKQLLHSDFKHLLVAGFLGAFTTYSTFSLESFQLIEEGHMMLAFLYMLSTTGVCLLGVWLGIYLTRSLL